MLTCIPSAQVRVGLNDTTVDFWDPAKAVAKLDRELVLAGLRRGDNAQDVSHRKQRGCPMILLQCKLGGHNCYNTASDDATKCAFIIDVCGAQVEN